MTTDEAKFILSAWRSGGQDASDPTFAPARKQAADDPDLGNWFRNEQAFDVIISEKLHAVQPPAGLRDRILAGARVSERRPWYRRTQLLAMAAAVAIAGILAALVAPFNTNPTGREMPAFAANFIRSGFALDKTNPDVSQLKAWLAQRNAPLPAKIPTNLASLEGLGCRTVQFEGHEVSLICFHNGKDEFHLFVARREDFPKLAELSKPQMQTREGWSTAAWTDTSSYYVLVSKAGEDEIRRLL